MGVYYSDADQEILSARIKELETENARLTAEVARYREVIGMQPMLHLENGFLASRIIRWDALSCRHRAVSSGFADNPYGLTMLEAFDAVEAIRKSKEGDSND